MLDLLARQMRLLIELLQTRGAEIPVELKELPV